LRVLPRKHPASPGPAIFGKGLNKATRMLGVLCFFLYLGGRKTSAFSQDNPWSEPRYSISCQLWASERRFLRLISSRLDRLNNEAKGLIGNKRNSVFLSTDF
jgi:hypothetical protein